MSTDEPNALATSSESRSLLDVIARAAVDPRVDIEKMERLLAMQERVIADQRKQEFFAALSRLAAKLPQVSKDGKVSYQSRGGQQVETKYATIEHIDEIVRPLYAEEGFAISWDSESPSATQLKIVGRLSHAAGHFEAKTVTLPLDTSGAKNGAQSVLSTISYGRRVITEMFFNIVKQGEDTDGANPETISEDQVKDIEALITEVKANRAKFLTYLGVDSLDAILARDYKKAINALETKRKASK